MYEIQGGHTCALASNPMISFVRLRVEVGWVRSSPVSVYCAMRIPMITTYALLARSPQPTPSIPVLSMKVWKTHFPD